LRWREQWLWYKQAGCPGSVFISTIGVKNSFGGFWLDPDQAPLLIDK
jgi:hypothetical protein